MYQTKKRVIYLCVFLLMVTAVFFACGIAMKTLTTRIFGFSVIPVLTAVLIVDTITAFMITGRDMILNHIKKEAFFTKETNLLSIFIDKLRDCYSLDDFYELIAKYLEQDADCTVLFIDRQKNYVLYNSPNRLSCSQELMETLELNFSVEWKEGLYFLGENFGVVTNTAKSRGFMISYKKFHFFVLCRYTKLFDTEVFKIFFDEFCRFKNRSETIRGLSEIAALSKEWKQLADTQQSFLPLKLPKIDKLSIAAYYRPLVNVSGDYYSVLPITPTKTLLMLGDVSGKGLAAALVMGLVMNTVKILDDKEDLPAMIKKIDNAIKGMHLQDKYTVLFIGIVDIEKMIIRYVNASMSDPLIITNSPSGYKIRPLTSNCSLVGIIDIDDVDVAEQKLFRDDVILMASDGVSEVMDENGVELGDTELYEETLKKSAAKSPNEFVDDIVNLIMEYNGGKKLRDDVTMLVAKIGR